VVESKALVLGAGGTAAATGADGAAELGVSGATVLFRAVLVVAGRFGIKRALAGGLECGEVEESTWAAIKPTPAAVTMPAATVAVSLCGQSAEAAVLAMPFSLAALPIMESAPRSRIEDTHVPDRRM
jgi:hypothetical protein